MAQTMVREVRKEQSEDSVITLKDIARISGYSIKTVSRAIHDHPDINEQTKKQVMEIVERYSYSPNWAARSLRNQKTHTIGYVVPNITNGFFGEIGMIIDSYFRRLNYSTLICFTSHSLDNELDSLRSLMEKNVEGIIVAPVGSFEQWTDKLPKLRETPLAIIDNRFNDTSLDYILHDNEHGADLLVDHLVGHGHSRIACVTGPVQESSGFERLLGYKHGLARHGISVDESIVRTVEWEDINGGYSATLELMESHNKPSAVFYANSQLLLGGYKAFHALSMRIPQDVAVVSFDQPLVIDALTPRPTALEKVEKEIADTTARILHHKITGNAAKAPQEIRIKSTLAIGESCDCKI